jgi:hypothetical protein
VRTDRRNILDVLLAALNVGERPAALRTLIKPHLDLLVGLFRRRAKGGRMALGPTRRSMLIRWLLVLVFASKGRRLTGSRTFEFFHTLLKRDDELFKRFEFGNALAQRVVLGLKRLILGFELLNPTVARIGIHARLLTSRAPIAISEVCAVDNDRESKTLL